MLRKIKDTPHLPLDQLALIENGLEQKNFQRDLKSTLFNQR